MYYFVRGDERFMPDPNPPVQEVAVEIGEPEPVENTPDVAERVEDWVGRQADLASVKREATIVLADDEHEVTARPAKAANLRSPERRKAKRESALSPWAVKELIEARTLLQSTEKKVAALEERQRANANSKTSSMKLKRKTATHSVKRELEEVVIRVSPRKRQRRETMPSL